MRIMLPSIMLILLLPAVYTQAVLQSLAKTWAAVGLMWAKLSKNPRRRNMALLIGVPFVLIWNWGGESTCQ